MKNPIQRITELEARVALLEGGVPAAAKAVKPKPKVAKFVRPLCDQAKVIVLLAFDELVLMKTGQPQPQVLATELQDHIRTLDEEGIVPSLNGAADTVRAIIAERCGYHVTWAATAITAHGSYGPRAQQQELPQ